MPIVRKAVVLAVPAALALGACSSDAEPEVTVPDLTVPDDTAPDLTAPDLTAPDLTLPDVTAPDLTVPDLTVPNLTIPEGAEDAARDALRNLGLTEEQIDCLVGEIGDTGEVPTLDDVTALLEECDIELSDLTPGG